MDIFSVFSQEKTNSDKVSRRAGRAIAVALCACSLMLALQLVLYVAIMFLDTFIPYTENETVGCLIDIVYYILYLVIPFALAKIIYTKFFKNDKDHFVKRVVPKKPVLFILGSLGVGYLVNIAVNILFGWFLQDFSTDIVEMPESPLGIILTYVAMALCPAIFEEWAFRGVIFKHLRPYGRLGALVISSVLFGLMHIDIPRVIFASVFGFILGVCYDYTGSLKVSMLIHFINNAISVTISYIPESNFTALLLSSLLIYAFMGVGIGALIYYGITGIAHKRISLNKPAVYGYKIDAGHFIKRSILNFGIIPLAVLYIIYFLMVYMQ